MLLLFFINKIKNLRQISEEKKSQLMGFKSCCLIYKSFFALKYDQNFIIR
jgi:restriction endonuclease